VALLSLENPTWLFLRNREGLPRIDRYLTLLKQCQRFGRGVVWQSATMNGA
jgi:hypothetical protein